MLKIEKLPIDKLFLEAKDRTGAPVNIFAGNHRVASERGFQRDVYDSVRVSWLERNADKYDENLDRPVEVASLNNGHWSLLDGGGRWWLSQKEGFSEMTCRIHEGLKYPQRSEMFYEFDRYVYKLGSVERFNALCEAGGEMEREISLAVQPYVIAKQGAGTLNCVQQLITIYTVKQNARLISRTAKAVANTGGWGGLKMGKEWTGSPSISGLLFAAVALVFDAAPSGFDEAAIRTAMSDGRYANKRGFAAYTMLSKVDPTLLVAQKSMIVARKLAHEANRFAKGRLKIQPLDLAESPLVEALNSRTGVFGSSGKARSKS